eukprot:CAMPEP_0117624358 /NCGR_PEP_ID=MMETSP0802-20121206/331_1 /TAXON_ID=38833 /ORGANISM="Micromonas sp., Strain CCMP2099" /LENGTH=69 /DNA_ID=CAMNT_0005428379 /DNA_START=36 /DNA_END=245 /DNA_ORIENTATION=+
MRRVARVLGRTCLRAYAAPLVPASRASAAVLPVRLVSLCTAGIPPGGKWRGQELANTSRRHDNLKRRRE